jgi:hypothetical protein
MNPPGLVLRGGGGGGAGAGAGACAGCGCCRGGGGGGARQQQQRAFAQLVGRSDAVVLIVYNGLYVDAVELGYARQGVPQLHPVQDARRRWNNQRLPNRQAIGVLAHLGVVPDDVIGVDAEPPGYTVDRVPLLNDVGGKEGLGLSPRRCRLRGGTGRGRRRGRGRLLGLSRLVVLPHLRRCHRQHPGLAGADDEGGPEVDRLLPGNSLRGSYRLWGDGGVAGASEAPTAQAQGTAGQGCPQHQGVHPDTVPERAAPRPPVSSRPAPEIAGPARWVRCRNGVPPSKRPQRHRHRHLTATTSLIAPVGPDLLTQKPPPIMPAPAEACQPPVTRCTKAEAEKSRLGPESQDSVAGST